MTTEDQDYEFNSRFDYIREAYGTESRLIREMDAADREQEDAEAKAAWARMSPAERFGVIAAYERSCAACRPPRVLTVASELPF